MLIMIKKFKNLPDAVKKSIAEQMKLLSWVLGGINGFSIHVFGGAIGIMTTIAWWLAFQFVAHYILHLIEIKQNEEV